MHCPKLEALPPAPGGRTGWPWTEESRPLPSAMPGGSPWPRISIATPSYKQGQFIEETIRSVLLQRYPNLEYIIIDGGSTDCSVEIIRRYEPWLAHWVSEPDRGQAHAINKGWAASSGEFLGWLNSDDVLEPRALELAVREMVRRGPDTVVVYGDIEKMDERGRLVCVRRGAPMVYAWMLRRLIVPVPQPGCLFRRARLEQVGWLDEQWQVVLDRDLFVRCGLAGEMAYLPETLARVRVHSDTKSVAHQGQWVVELPPMYEEFFARGDLPAEINALRRATVGWAYLLAARIANGTDRPVLPPLWNGIRHYPGYLLHPRFWLILVRWLANRVRG